MDPRLTFYTRVNGLYISNSIILQRDDISIIIDSLRKTGHIKACCIASDIEIGYERFCEMVLNVAFEGESKNG